MSCTTGVKYKVSYNYLNNGHAIQEGVYDMTLADRNAIAQYELPIFVACVSNNYSNANLALKGKIYRFKISENTAIIRDFIPCYRKIDNVAGLYDLINNVFYINCGSDNFVVGPDTPIIGESKIATIFDLDKKQDSLVSGINIKTINNRSILGSGNINISGTGGSDTWGCIVGDLSDQEDLMAALDAKQATINNNNKLSTAVVDDTNSTNKFISATNVTYQSNTKDLLTLKTADTVYRVGRTADIENIKQQLKSITDSNAFMLNENITLAGTSWVRKDYDFNVTFKETTKVTLHIDEVIGHTEIMYAHLYLLDENGNSTATYEDGSPAPYISLYYGIRDTAAIFGSPSTKVVKVCLYPSGEIPLTTGVANYYGVTCYAGDALVYHNKELHVGANRHYTTIQAAVDAANDGDTIIVHPGVYDESVKVYGDTKDTHSSTKYVRIIGTDRDSCILTHSTVYYSYPPLEIAKGYVENITIIGTGEHIDGVQPAYCVHMDYDTSIDKNVQFNNCRFVNTWYPCVGTGLRNGQHESFLNCTFECDGGAAFLFHEQQANNKTDQNILFDGCTFISNSSYDAVIHVQETINYTGNNVNVTFRRCIVKHRRGSALARCYYYDKDTGESTTINPKAGGK